MLDEIDLKILDVLQQNARISMYELGDRVGLSATPCTRRVRQLEEIGIIDQYVTVLNARTLGYGLTALISVRIQHSKQSRTLFEESVRKMARVLHCYAVTGNYDYLLAVCAADMNDLSEWQRHELIVTPGVSATYTSVVMEVLKNSTALPLPAESKLLGRHPKSSRLKR